jgi:hypothetical protein
VNAELALIAVSCGLRAIVIAPVDCSAGIPMLVNEPLSLIVRPPSRRCALGRSTVGRF